jgi:hypothetical protein
MTPTISIRCDGCRARIKAAFQLRGQTRPCPGCKRPVLVQLLARDDEGPVLVMDNGRAYRPASMSA